MADTAAVTAEDAEVAAALEDKPEVEKTEPPTRKSLASLIHSKMQRQSQFPELETEAVSETENIGGDSTPNLKDENPSTPDTRVLDKNIEMEALEKAKELSGKRSRKRSRSSENTRKSASRKRSGSTRRSETRRSGSVRRSKSRRHSSGSSQSSFSDEMEYRERRRSFDPDRGHFRSSRKSLRKNTKESGDHCLGKNTFDEDSIISEKIGRMDLGTIQPKASDLNANEKGQPEQQKLEYPSFLEGWTREEKIRQSGKTAGRVDVYYKSPTGKTVRSKPELSRILGDQHDLSMVSFIPTNAKKCHKGCNTVCLKLPETLYQLPGEILYQLTASPLDTLKQLVITPGFDKAHIKLLFHHLAKATALKEMDVNGNSWSGSFSEVATDVAVVLGKCTKIKLNQFKETSDFWKKCMTSARSNCEEFTVVECNGLETIVTMLPGLLPKLICLEVIDPDLEGFRQLREKKLFLSFFQEKVSLKSKLELLSLDKLWGLLLDVPPEILVPALAPLGSFSICRTSLYLPQLEPLVKSWRKITPVSVSVESSWNQLASDLLVKSVANISSLSLKGVKLEVVVLLSLLSAVAGGCAVEKLDLRGNDMSNIAADVLVAAINKLRIAVFTKCKLGEEAVMDMLRSLVATDHYQGVLEELHLTRPTYTFDMSKEEELVKLVREGAGLTCLEICEIQCKCEEYCNWKE